MVKISKGKNLFLLGIICLPVLFTTCKNNIGLGSSIDITPPTIDRIYPPIGAVIKGNFTVAVDADDDTQVTAVTATIVDASDKQVDFFNLQSAGSGRWLATLNTRGETGYPLKDGSYTMRIIVKDKFDKTTRGEAAFTIDNTPPLLILNRPSTAATTPADPNADIFGDKFSLKGQLYDKSDVEKLTIAASDDKGNPKGNPAVLYNVPQSLNITVDSFFKSAAGQTFYRSIYGDNPIRGAQQYSYTITLTDSAREYTDPTKTVGTGEGNSTSSYYLYTDLYTMLNESRYKPADVYAMMQSGIYGSGDARSVTPTTEGNAWTAEKVIAFLQQPEIKLGTGGNRNGTFVLNPSINPKYGIEGLTPHEVSANPAIPITYDEIYAGSKINIKLSTNFDEDPLNAASQYEFYLVKADTEAELRDLSSKSFDVNEDKDLYSDPEAKTLKSNVIRLAIKPEDIKYSGSNYVATTTLDNLSFASYYFLQVRGCDQNSPEHKMIADPKGKTGGYYIFKMKTTGLRPEVRIAQINGKDPQAGRFYIGKGSGAAFDAVVDNAAGGTVVYTLTPSADSGDPVDSGKKYYREEKNFPALPVHFDIPSSKFAQNESGSYRITVQAKDTQGSGTSLVQEYQLYYDVEGPVISANVSDSVTAIPTLKGDIYDAGVGVDYSTYGKPTAVYTYNGGAEQPLTFHKAPTAADNTWELDSLPSSEGRYKVTLTAKDTLGNSATKELEFTYDAASPILREINGKNIAELKLNPAIIDGAVDSGTNKHYIDITGSITEGNGIASVTVDGQNATVSGTTFNYRLQKDTDWKGSIAVVVTDLADKTDAITLNVTIDTEAPAFTEMKVGNGVTSQPDVFTNGTVANATYTATTIPVKGTLKDLGSGVKEVTAAWMDGTETKSVIFPAVADSAGIYKIEGALGLGALTDAVVTFKATDGAGKSSAEWKVNVSVVSSSVILAIGKDITASTPPLEKEGAHYVHTPFKIKVKGKWEGNTPLDLDFSVTKDGTAAQLSSLQPTVTCDNASVLSASPVNVSGDKITGLISGKKTSSENIQPEYTITFTPRSTGEDDGRYVFTFKHDTSNTRVSETIYIDTKGPSIEPSRPNDGAAISLDDTIPSGKLATTMFDNAGVNTATARAYYRKKTSSALPASDYKNLTAAQAYIELSGSPLGGAFKNAKVWKGSLYGSDPDTAGTSPHTTSAATAVPAPDLTEGEYEVWFGAQDNLNQINTTSPITVVYDTADPTVVLELKPQNSSDYKTMGELYVNHSFKVRIIGKDSNDIESVELKHTQNGTTWSDAGITRDSSNTITDPSPHYVTTTNEYTVNFPAGQEGAYTLRAIVTDKAGKQAVETCAIVYDATAPSLTVPALSALTGGTLVGSTYWVKDPVMTISGSAEDNPASGANKASGVIMVEYSTDNGGTWKPITTDPGSWTAPVQLGTGGVTFRATDKAGNKKEELRQIKADVRPPRLTVTKIKQQGASGAGTADLSEIQYLNASTKLDITYTVEDETGGSGIPANSVTVNIKADSVVKHSYTNRPAATGENTATINVSDLTALADGDYTVELSVMDNAGNSSVVRTFNIKIDKKSPTITMLSPAPDTKHEASDAAANWAKTTRLFGNIRIAGSFEDKGSGMSSPLKYSYTIGKDKTTLLPGDKFQPNGNSSWVLVIGNAENYCNDANAAKYVMKRYNIDNTENPNGIICKIPLYITAEDQAGNKAEQAFYIMVDSSGKTPVIDIQAPEQKLSSAQGSYGGLEVITVGGTVQFSGLVQTANPAAGTIKKVYVSFSTTENFDDDFTADFKAHEDSTAVSHNLAKLTDNKGVKIAEDASGLRKWSFTVDTDKFVAGKKSGGAAVATNGSVSLYYKIQGENNHGETAWSSVRKITFDQNYPYVKDSHRLRGTASEAYVNNLAVIDGDKLVCDLLSTDDINTITLNSSTNGADYIKSIGTKTGNAAIIGTTIGTEALFERITGAASGYKMTLPIKLAGLKDPEQILSIEVSITDNKASNPKTKFVQFNLKYDTTDPAVIFGTPVGKIGTGNFFAASANNVIAATANTPLENLYVFVETKNGSAKEIKVTSIGENYITYANVGDIFDEQSMYVLVRKNPIIYDSAASDWQLQGFAYDTGTGVNLVTAKFGTGASKEIKTFTPELGYFSSFKESFKTKDVVPEGQTALKLSAEDKAGRKGTAPDTTVYLRNKPLKISKVHFKTDLNGDNAYSDDNQTGRVEIVTAAGNDKYINTSAADSKDQKNYIQKDMDIHDEFSLKNKDKSQIMFELAGGSSTVYSYDVYKADSENNPVGSVLKTGTLTNQEINFTSADFAADKIPEGDNQKFVIVLKETGVDDPDRQLRLTVNLNVRTQDPSQPQVTVLPFYWNGEGKDESTGKPRNSLPNGDPTKGHIEISTVSEGTGVSDVSGTVVLRGTAYHPTRLSALELTVPGVNPNPSVSYTSGAWTSSGGLTVADERLDVHGHWVVWEYTWVTGTPALDQTITVKATRTDGGTTISSTGDEGSDLAVKTAKERGDSQSMTLAEGDTAVKGQFIRLVKGEESYLITVNEVKNIEVNGKTTSVVSWRITNIARDIKNYYLYKIDYTGDPQPKPTFNRSSIKLNVVPYITGIETSLSIAGANEPDLYARTALGRYPVKDSETIKVKGFNLTGAVCEVNGIPSGNLTPDGTAWKLTLASTVTSGKLTAKVNGIEAINNRNANTRPYHKGAKTSNNNNLTDDVALDVWQFTEKAALPERGTIAEPVMRINPANGMIGFAFANGPDYFSMSKGTENSYTKWHKNYDDFANVDFIYDSSGTSHAVVTGRDINSGANQAGKFTYVTSRWKLGGSFSDGNNYQGYRALRLESLGQEGDMKASGNNILDKTRIQHPSLAVAESTGTDSRLYLAYYDSINDQIRFKAGTLTADAMNWDKVTGGKYKKKDGTDSTIGVGSEDYRKAVWNVGKNKYDMQYSKSVFPRRPFGQFVDEAWPKEVIKYNQDNVSIVAGKYMKYTDTPATVADTGNKPGSYLSLAVVPGSTAADDVAVLIWFDATNKKLMYTYNKNPTKEDASITPADNPPEGILDRPDKPEMNQLKFDARTIPPRNFGTSSGDGYWYATKEVFGKANIGEYCKIAVDKNGGIHIAAYSTDTKDLHYAYMSKYDGAQFTTSVVDSYGITGSQIRLDVALSASGKPIPYIGYYSSSAGYAKLAYLVEPTSGFEQGAAGAEDGYFTGKWEVTCIPTTSDVVEDNINVGVWKNTDGKIKTSVTGTNNSGNASGKVYGNGTANPVLGYATTIAGNGFIETAQKK